MTRLLPLLLARNTLVLAAAGGSAALLAAAWVFQALGYAPCELCLWQRYPHGAAVGIGALALLFPVAALPLVGALAALATAGVGAYHTGVERGWWEGPSSCSSGGAGGLSAEDLMERIMTAPIVRCDEVPWDLFGISMASWNVVASLGLAAVWLVAWMRGKAA